MEITLDYPSTVPNPLKFSQFYFNILNKYFKIFWKNILKFFTVGEILVPPIDPHSNSMIP